MPTCINCGAEFTAKRKDASLCSAKCRVAWSRKKAAEEGDPSVEWKPEEQNERDYALVLPKSLKKQTEECQAIIKGSKSHVVQLKERVKERIKGKGEAPSSTSQTKMPADSDVPPDDAVFVPPDFGMLGPIPKISTWLAVEDHGTVNDLARQVIFSKVRKKSLGS